MASEIFRFVNLRGPRRREQDPAPSDVILSGESPSPLTSELLKLHSGNRPRAEYEARATRFIDGDQYALRAPLSVDIARLDTWLATQPQPISSEQFAAGVRETLGSTIEALLRKAEFKKTRDRPCRHSEALGILQQRFHAIGNQTFDLLA